MKRANSSSDTSTPEPKEKKRSLFYIPEMEDRYGRECLTATWLEYDTEMNSNGRRRIATKLQCSIHVRAKFKRSIATCRNFSPRWLDGADFVRTDSIPDHAKADQHVHAMHLLRREQARASDSGCTTYAPISRALMKKRNNCAVYSVTSS